MNKEWIGVSMIIVSLAIGVPMYVKSQVNLQDSIPNSRNSRTLVL